MNGSISKNIMKKGITFFLLPLFFLILLFHFQNCSSGASPTTSNTNDTNKNSTDSTNSTSAYNSPTLISDLSSAYVTEGNSVTITLTLSTTNSSNTSFMYQTYDGTAHNGTNYNETSGVITIPAASLSTTINIQTLNQNTSEGMLYFYLKVGQLDLTENNYTTSVIRILDSDSSSSSTTGFNQLATGLYHTCGINSSNALYCWGYNTYGQLGDGSTVSNSTPHAVSGLSSGITSVATGANHSCAIAGGVLKCWGYNNKGQLGNSTNTNYLAPKIVNDLSDSVIAVTAGQNFSCAIKSGALKCWGENSYGQLGDGTLFNRSTPIAVTGLSSNITQISAGYSHVCAIQSEALYCWGNNTNGQLGDGTKTSQTLPQLVSGMESNVTSVAAGYNYTCAVQSQKLKCWGNNSNGQLGTSNTTEHIAPYYTGISNANQVFINLVTTCLITTENLLSCWGYNGYGQVGTSSNTGSITAPNTVQGSGVESVSRGHGYHVCGILNSGTNCWGYNYYGQLGTGNTTNQNSPNLISF